MTAGNPNCELAGGHRPDIKCRKDLSADTVFALLAAQSDRFIRVDALLAVILQYRGR
jgi:hypothetical protein